MPLPGGPASKLGLRYERLWAAYQLLRLLDGKFDSVRLEEPGVDKAEFVIRRGDCKEFHQVKRAGKDGKWSVASLKAERVLQSMGELLKDPKSNFVFVSRCAASELSDICESARHAESEQEFMTKFLKAESRRKPFEYIRRVWQCNLETALDYLKRIEVRTMGEQDLEETAQHYAQALFHDTDHVLDELLHMVDQSVHKTVPRDHLRDVMRGKGCVLRQVANPKQQVVAIRQATELYLQQAQRRLIHQTLVSRVASQEMVEKVGNSTTVLIGKAGTGKTACAVEIVKGLLERQMQVLAFRLDRHVSALDTSDLGESLGLEESPVLTLAAAVGKNHGTGVLVVDQLDAVSVMSGRSSEALDLVESLLEEADAKREQINLHVIIVCRSFDWDHDHRLRRLIRDDDARVTVGEFTDEETQDLLQQGGFQPSLFQAAQLRLLRVPQNLSLFLASSFTESKAPNFKTVTELFDRYWEAKRELVLKRIDHGDDHWMKTLKLLCSEMDEKQELSVRREVLDDVPPPYLNQMVSEGVLVSDDNRYGFGHESFFDYCYTRVLFLPESKPLTSILRLSEQHLFRRGQIRQVLTYARDADFDRYMKEMRSLLSDQEIRAHIKEIVFALLADVAGPREEEWHIWDEWTRPAFEAVKLGAPCKEMLCELARRRLLGSKPWFEFLVSNGVVEQWLKSRNERLADMAVEHYLWLHQRDTPARVVMLLEPYVGSGRDWRRRLERFMMRVDVSGSRELFDLFLRLIDDGTLDGARRPSVVNSTFWSMVYGFETKRPEWVGELLAHWIRRRLAILEKNGDMPCREQLLGHDHEATRMFMNAARSAPLKFVQHVLPVVLEVSDLTARGDVPRHDKVWGHSIKMAYLGPEEGCLEALTKAMERMADIATVEQCDKALGELRRRDTYVANHLLLAFYRGSPDRFGGKAVATFCAEPWRFNCGASSNKNWYAMKTISAIAPHLSHNDLSRLEDAILNYVPQFEVGVERRSVYRHTQFALLSAIPEELRSKKAKQRFQELERKFREVPEAPREIRAGIIPSPISPSEAEKMTDDQWLKAMQRYATGECLNDRGEHVGGAHQLSQVLAENVRKEPERFACLAMRFDANMNPAYMQQTLLGLGQVELDDVLKIDVCRKAFAESRKDCGGEIARAIESVAGALPEEAVNMLDWLATKHPNPEREQWQEEATYGGKNDRIYEHGINTVRGSAAMSIQRLILQDSNNLERFRGTLEKMVKDRSSAVLSCVAGIFEAVAVTNPKEALALFLTMDMPTENLLATHYVARFMQYSLADGFKKLSSLIETMICSNEEEVAKQGAILAGLALLHGHDAQRLVETALAKGEAQRLGIATVASSNIEFPDCRDWCERRLVELFEDEATEVRREAASCFHHLRNEPLERYEDLVDKFSASTAFSDDSFSILMTLEKSRQKLPGMTCLICERYLERFSDTRSAADPYILVKLAFRTYQQYQKDHKWSKRTLDVIDQLCLKALPSTVEQFDAFER